MFKRAEPSYRILVSDAARGCAVAIIRSLGLQGWHVVAGDSSRPSPGMNSKYAAERFWYPNPAERPQEFVEALLAYVKEHQIDLVIPVTDATILPLAAARERFEPHTKLAIPGSEALAAVTDKQRTIELAERLGVPVPRTVLVHTAAEAEAAAAEFAWPVVLKPQASRSYQTGRAVESYEVTYADNAESLIKQVAAYEGRSAVLLQEYCAGRGMGVELLLDRGRPLAAFQHERLREIPLTGGASAFRRSVPLDDILYDYSTRLLAALEWTGLAMVEFKVSPSGEVRLMEINGRVWGSLPLAVHSGVDFPARLVELWLGDQPAGDAQPRADYQVGVRSRNLELELVWIAKVLFGSRSAGLLPLPARSAGLRAIGQLMNPWCRFDILSFSDPRPGIAELGKIARKFASKGRKGKHS